MMLYVDYTVLVQQAHDLYIALYSKENYTEKKHAMFILSYIKEFRETTNVSIVAEDKELYESLKRKAELT